MLDGLWATIADPNDPLAALPVTEEVAKALGQIPRAVVADMPDRIIAATALVHKLAACYGRCQTPPRSHLHHLVALVMGAFSARV